MRRLLVGLWLLSVAAPAAALEPWDQEEMTRLSAELASAMRGVRDAWRKDPVSRSRENPNRRAALRMDQILRDLDRQTGSLAATVANGGSYEETRGTARKIGTLLNDAEIEARSLRMGAWMGERVRPAVELLDQIAPYYGGEPLLDPETRRRLGGSTPSP